MSEDIYKNLLENLASRGTNRAGAHDLPEFYDLAKELFTPEEAEVASNQPTGEDARETATEIAEKMNRNVDEVTKILETMTDKGTCISVVRDGVRYYLSPVLGYIANLQFSGGKFTDREKRLAKLFSTYRQAVRALTGPQIPPIPVWRVIPVEETISAENVVLNYDQVSRIIEKNDSIAVFHCRCRSQALLTDPEYTCNAPMEVCMSFNKESNENRIERGIGRRISKKEAFEILKTAEKTGLIHTTYKTQDADFICNCCPDHCGAITWLLNIDKPSQHIHFSYQPVIKQDLCTLCEECINLCKMTALSLKDDKSIILNIDRCIGCGICASACTGKAIEMKIRSGIPEVPISEKALETELIAAAKKLRDSGTQTA